jgi:general secretion pathway protein I
MKKPPERCAPRAAGFTLVEILVALAVLAIALAAVMRSITQSIDTSAALRERTMALWVAQNRLATHQLQRDFPSPDSTDGNVTLGGREWRWREQVATTPDADLRRIEIEVRAVNGEQMLGRLTGFLRRPTAMP